MKRALLIAGLLAVFFISCKKSKPADETATTTTITTPTTGSTLDLIRDSMYLYAKEEYYWHNDLPAYDTFKPRSFTGTDDLTALNNELYALSQYAINPATGKAYEYNANEPGSPKYSFIDEGESSTRLSAVTGDFGFSPGYNSQTDLRVIYVYPGSPADNAGLKRGYQITSINGQTNLTYSTSNVNFIVNAYAYSSSITMTLLRPDKTTLSVSLNTASYKINPVITSKVLDWNSKKVGYIVFNSFVTKTSAQDALNAAFTSFTAAGVSDLVVDLRYNGGGYVETAEYLSDLIAPTAANGQVMYTAYYNDILSANKETLLKNQVRRDANGALYNYGQVNYATSNTQEKFAKAGTLNINRVFFLVTGSTASASELTINNLRPYMNVQLIGRTTYGKPVGFFDININKYTMYIPEFETKNSAAQGGYYTGMTPGVGDYAGKSIADDMTKDFGDTTEGLLAQALAFIKDGKYPNDTQLQIQSTDASAGLDVQNAFNSNVKLSKRQFKGMLYQNPGK